MRARRSVGEALKWAIVMTTGRRAMATAFTFGLAVLLGPRDFGIVAIALVYVAFIRMLMEQGFTTAIIQRENLEEAHLDSAFWLNFGWCFVLAAGSAASAPLIAKAYGTPRLGPVIAVLSILIIFEGLQVVQQAVMERQLDFKRLAVRTNVSVFVGGAVGIPLALKGAGVWALVAQQLATELMLLVLIWGMTSWIPRFRFSTRHARELFSFSLSVFAANLAGFVNRRADALLMGLFFGPAAVGIYRIADRLVDILLDVTMRPVGLVSLPVLSRLQDDPRELRKAVTRLLHTTLVMAVPALLVLLACSDAVLGVLGGEWAHADAALKFLCLVGIGKAIGFFSGPVLFAANRARFRATMLWTLAGVSVLSVVGVGLALTGANVKHQVLGLAASRAVLFLPVLVPVNLAIIAHFTGFSVRDFLPRAVAPVAAGLAAIAVERSLAVTGVADGLPAVPRLLVVGGLCGLTAVGLLLALEPFARQKLRELRHGLWPSAEGIPLHALAPARSQP